MRYLYRFLYFPTRYVLQKDGVTAADWDAKPSLALSPTSQEEKYGNPSAVNNRFYSNYWQSWNSALRIQRDGVATGAIKSERLVVDGASTGIDFITQKAPYDINYSYTDYNYLRTDNGTRTLTWRLSDRSKVWRNRVMYLSSCWKADSENTTLNEFPRFPTVSREKATNKTQWDYSANHYYWKDNLSPNAGWSFHSEHEGDSGQPRIHFRLDKCYHNYLAEDNDGDTDEIRTDALAYTFASGINMNSIPLYQWESRFRGFGPHNRLWKFYDNDEKQYTNDVLTWQTDYYTEPSLYTACYMSGGYYPIKTIYEDLDVDFVNSNNQTIHTWATDTLRCNWLYNNEVGTTQKNGYKVSYFSYDENSACYMGYSGALCTFLGVTSDSYNLTNGQQFSLSSNGDWLTLIANTACSMDGNNFYFTVRDNVYIEYKYWYTVKHHDYGVNYVFPENEKHNGETWS